ncbi:MAG: methyltransferase [Clostridia bacterium]|nr:methyltransferase [Clostridia bacterium]
MKTTEYLDNGITVFQDDELYTFTSDPILLSRFAKVGKNETVADFCAGVGVVGFNLYALNGEKISSLTFFEMQKPLFDLCQENIVANGLENKFSAVNCKVQDLPKEFYGKFSLIVCNPPYMPKGTFGAERSDIDFCRRETALSLEELVSAVAKGLKFGGKVCMVHRADRLADLIFFMRFAGIEPKRILPVAARGKEPYLVLTEGVKGGKSGLKLLSTLFN